MIHALPLLRVVLRKSYNTKKPSKIKIERNFYVLILYACLILLVIVLIPTSYKSGGKIT
jgi:hypothetical protein